MIEWLYASAIIAMILISGLCEILMTTNKPPILLLDNPRDGSMYSLKSNINESSIIIRYHLDDIDYVDNKNYEMCINVIRFNSR
jgi:hypothetical protein